MIQCENNENNEEKAKEAKMDILLALMCLIALAAAASYYMYGVGAVVHPMRIMEVRALCEDLRRKAPFMNKEELIEAMKTLSELLKGE